MSRVFEDPCEIVSNTNCGLVCTGPFYFPDVLGKSELCAMYLSANFGTGKLFLKDDLTDSIYMSLSEALYSLNAGAFTCGEFLFFFLRCARCCR
jgi:hypothetical protein